MKTRERIIVVQRLDERRYALAIDGIVRYVGSEEECQRRIAMLVPNNDRAKQDEALARLWRTNAIILGTRR
jgi:hypothetical protein